MTDVNLTQTFANWNGTAPPPLGPWSNPSMKLFRLAVFQTTPELRVAHERGPSPPRVTGAGPTVSFRQTALTTFPSMSRTCPASDFRLSFSIDAMDATGSIALTSIV